MWIKLQPCSAAAGLEPSTASQGPESLLPVNNIPPGFGPKGDFAGSEQRYILSPTTSCGLSTAFCGAEFCLDSHSVSNYAVGSSTVC